MRVTFHSQFSRTSAVALESMRPPRTAVPRWPLVQPCERAGRRLRAWQVRFRLAASQTHAGLSAELSQVVMFGGRAFEYKRNAQGFQLQQKSSLSSYSDEMAVFVSRKSGDADSINSIARS